MFLRIFWSAALLGCASIGFCEFTHAQANSGRVVSVSGKVLIRTEGTAAGDLRQLQVGDTLKEGDVINTSSESSTKILMNDRTILDLGASTLFKIAEYKSKKSLGDRQVALEMDYGKIRASVNTPLNANGKFKLKTRSATMGVRGTEFVVSSEIPVANRENKGFAGKTEIVVVKGNVAVATSGQGTGGVPKESMVGANQKMVAGPAIGGAVGGVDSGGSTTEGKVEKISVQETASTVQTAKLEDKTFQKSVVLDDAPGGSKGNSNSTTLTEAIGGMNHAIAEQGNRGVQDWGFLGAEIRNPIQTVPVLPPGSAVGLTVIFRK